MIKRTFSRNSIILLVVIGAIAFSMALVTFEFSNFTSKEIIKISSQNIRESATGEAFHLSKILVNKLNSVDTNLQVISASSSVVNREEWKARQFFDKSQTSTSDMTAFYMWLDENGKIVWMSNVNQTTFDQVYGLDLSYRDYFTEVRNNRTTTYYSNVIESNDEIPRIYISQPITDNGVFRGAAVAAIDLATVGGFLEREISPFIEGSVGLMDQNAVILYSQNQTLIGKNFYGDEFQSALPAALKDPFNTIIARSLDGRSGAEDITFGEITATIAYQPVATDRGQNIAILYIVTPHQFSNNVTFLVDQQRNFITTIVVVIGLAAIGIALLVISWNRTLSTAVHTRTNELQSKTQELEDANEQLKTHGRMQKEFINIAAHELRTPTQAILGYSELLQTEQKDSEEMVKAVYRNALRLQRLASDILDVTRIESQTLRLDKEKFKLDEAISTVIKDAHQGLLDGKIRFEYNPTDIMVEADKSRIIQVLSNLVSNSVKFTKDGAVTISAAKTDGQVSVSVTDAGTGIDSEMIPRLFTKFATKSQTGTGLGLFISKSIVEAHGGTISGKNNQDGRGATFSFTLPVSDEEKP